MSNELVATLTNELVAPLFLVVIGSALIVAKSYINKITESTIAKHDVEKVEKVEIARNVGKTGKIPVLIYGNGLFDYALCTEDGEEELWNSNDGYDILIIGDNCKLELQQSNL